jgi:hypothetical protein
MASSGHFRPRRAIGALVMAVPALCLLVATIPASAQGGAEGIAAYDVTIRIEDSGSIVVQENID